MSSLAEERFGKDFMKFSEKIGKQAVETIANEAVSLFFPRRCPVCEDILLPGQLICSVCDAKVKRISEPVCKKCGKPLENERSEYCSDCGRKKHFYTQGKAVLVYEGDIRRSMYRFKYANKREYAAFYAKEAEKSYGRWLEKKGVQAIVPIPMYVWKKRQRGYNQAEVFAKTLGKHTGIYVDCRLIKRIRNTVPQKELNDVERRQNLKNAFQLIPDIVEYKQVVLVDDIYTTGSTMDAVAEVLLAAGVQQIYYICISIGKGY